MNIIYKIAIFEMIVFGCILLIEYLKIRALQASYDALIEQTTEMYKIIGYYTLRFGSVTREDINNLKGISKERFLENDTENETK